MAPASSTIFGAAALLALLACAAADGTVTAADGTWTQLAPTGNAPQGRLWHTGATTGGKLYVAGGSSASHNDTFAYDTETNSWVDLSGLPVALKAADMCISGGIILLFGGKTADFSTDLVVIRIPTDDYFMASLDQTSVPDPRDAHTLNSLAGIVYLFGGWDEKEYKNDLWGLDSSSLVLRPGEANPKVKWVQLLANGAVGAPHARNSHSVVGYGGKLYLFGGFSHDVATSGPWVQCAAKDGCVFYNDLWVLNPPAGGDPAGLQPIAGSSWTQLRPSGTAPPGRYGQAMVALGESLYVWGGKTKDTVLDDMWEYNIPQNMWRQRFPAGTYPSRRYSPVAAAIGTSMYMFAGSSGGGDMWRYTPATVDLVQSLAATDKAQALAQAAANNSVSLGGVNAGIVITILMLIAVIFLLVQLGRKINAGSGGGYTTANL